MEPDVIATRPSSARRELLRALGSLAEHPSDPVAAALDLPTPLDRADHTQVFAFCALPYASAYLATDGMLGGAVAARVGGFWSAVGYPAPEPADHLTALVGLYAGLTQREEAEPDPARQAMLTQARSALLWEHLLPWLGMLLDVARRSAIAPWAQWADLTEEAFTEEWARLGQPEPELLPSHLRHAPPPLDPDFDIARLLVPVRTGMVLTRPDLAGIARHLGLGVRLTGRLPTLEVLLAYDQAEVLARLAGHAAAWERLHLARPGPSPITRFWADRAANTRHVLTAMAGL